MKAVILAAGKGTRMGELTKNLPKPLLKIKSKTLLEYKMDVLPAECNEVIIIVGYLGEHIKDYFGHEYNGKKITCVYSEPLGTGYALWQAKDYLRGRFIVMCGDDLYAREDVQKCVSYPLSALAFKTLAAQSGGKIITNEDGYVKDIQEGNHPTGSVIATGMYVLDDTVFDMPLVEAGNGKEEFGLPQTILQVKDVKIMPVFATKWHQVSVPGDLKLDENELRRFL